jgi:hypothetical protein
MEFVSVEEQERGCGNFRKLRMAVVLKCVVLTSSVEDSS